MMDSTSREYLLTYENLVEELHSSKSDRRELQLEISKLYEENKRLNQELKENVFYNEQVLSEKGLSTLKKQYDAAIAAKNSIVVLWQEALVQLETQEKLLIGKRSIVETGKNETEKTIEHVKKEYTRALNVMSSELVSYRNELANTKSVLELKTSELDSCVNDLDVVRMELEGRANECAALVKENSSLKKDVFSNQSLLTEAQNFLSESKKEMATLRLEHAELSSQMSNSKEEREKLKAKVAECEKDAKESLLTAQEAILKRKEMAYREEQYLNEIKQLKASANLEAERVALRFKSEIKETQKQAFEKVQSLMDELETLHLEIANKHNLFEKAVREKRALESKLEALHGEASASNGFGGNFENLCRRLTATERMRDEFASRVRMLEKELSDVKAEKDMEMSFVLSECNTAKESLDSIASDFHKSSADKIKLSEENGRLERRCLELEKELKATNSKRHADAAGRERKLVETVELLSNRLRYSEENHKQVCDDLQQVLDAEINVNKKWKNVCEDLVAKSEAHINELCDAILALQEQNSTLLDAWKQRHVHVPEISTFRMLRDSNISDYNS